MIQIRRNSATARARRRPRQATPFGNRCDRSPGHYAWLRSWNAGLRPAWNGASDNPSPLSAVSAMTRPIGAASAKRSRCRRAGRACGFTHLPEELGAGHPGHGEYEANLSSQTQSGRSGNICQRSVKPSADSTLVRTRHLPLLLARGSRRDQDHPVRSNAEAQSPEGAAQPARRCPSRDAWLHPAEGTRHSEARPVPARQNRRLWMSATSRRVIVRGVPNGRYAWPGSRDCCVAGRSQFGSHLSTSRAVCVRPGAVREQHGWPVMDAGGR